MPWRARCVETRTPGSASGPQKRTGGNADTALRADSTKPITELASPTISRADDDCGDGMYYNYETLAANPGYRWTWSSIRGFRFQFRIVVRFRSQSPRPDCWTPSTPSTPTSQTRA
jgi:hypothetical protein